MNTLIKKLKRNPLFFCGLIMIILVQFPLIYLGTDATVVYHDQLDGEIIAYIYQAKYLFSGSDTIYEFLNGMPKTSLTPPAPLAVLLFCIMSPFAAYVVLQILGQVIAFLGMYLLVKMISKNKYVAVIIAFLYAMLPFPPVYGLTQYGVPMLLYCFYLLFRKKHRIVGFVYIALYTGLSSLVLCGYAWLVLLGIATVYLLMIGDIKKHAEIPLAFLTMLCIYLLENIALLRQVLGINDGFVSHKTEYVLSGGTFWQKFLEYLRYNHSCGTDYHEGMWILVGVVVLYAAFRYKKWEHNKRQLFTYMIIGVGCVVLICALAAFWSCDFGLMFRRYLGSFGSIRVERLLWFAPAIWYVILAMCLVILCAGTFKKQWIGYLISACMVIVVGGQILLGSSLKSCIQEMLIPEYDVISWSDYLAMGVMEQVEDFLYEEEGLRKEDYKVASLGIDPAAALYHGFYCVDGYSNNYDVEYKHKFRKVLEPEFAKSKWLQEYYDNWGNRCYLFSSEVPGYYTIQKGGFYFTNLEIDTEALKELGCDYILSAAYIQNADALNLQWLQEKCFETEKSYYRIFVYKINE